MTILGALGLILQVRVDKSKELQISYLSNLVFTAAVIHVVVLLGQADALENHLSANLCRYAISTYEGIIIASLLAVETTARCVLNLDTMTALEVMIV